jgi:hypothetical protein
LESLARARASAGHAAERAQWFGDHLGRAMSLSPEQRARLQRVLADELGAAAVASAVDDGEFIAEIERRLSTVADPGNPSGGRRDLRTGEEP